MRSLTVGYDVVNDPQVLEPLVSQYFAVLERIWEERTYKIAEYIVEGLYPGSLVGPELIQATNTWLDAHPEPAALRRMIQENLAGVERALKVQALDAAQ